MKTQTEKGDHLKNEKDSVIDVFRFENISNQTEKAKLDILKLKETSNYFKIYTNNRDHFKETIILSVERGEDVSQKVTLPLIVATYQNPQSIINKDRISVFNHRGELLEEKEYPSLTVSASFIWTDNLLHYHLFFNILPKSVLYFEFHR